MTRTPIRRGIRRVFRLAMRGGPSDASAIDAEIQSHLEQRIDALVRLGYSRDDAAAEARRRFGDIAAARARLIAQARRHGRRMTILEWFGTLRQDVVLTGRRVVTRPTFALVAVCTLALGVGANTTVFAWMDGLVLNPLPVVHNANTLVALQTLTPSGGTQSTSYPDYLDWAAASHTLRDVVAYRREQLSLRLSADDDARSIWGVLVSSNYFDALGLQPALGRFFRQDESGPVAKAGEAPVAVIGYEMWQRDFAGRGDVLGKPVWANGQRLTIVGVAPRGFHGTNVGFGFDFWAPVTMEPSLLFQPAAKLTYRNSRWIRVFARLAPNSSVALAQQEMKQIGRDLSSRYADDKNVEPAVVALLDAEASAFLKPTFTALLGATGLLLLVVVFNMTGLALVRTAARRDELAIRAALGAGRARIAQQFVVEAALIAVVAIPVALGVAQLGRSVLDHFLDHVTFPVATPPALSAGAVVFTVATMSVVVFVIALWPAMRAWRRIAASLGSGGGRTMTGRTRGRDAIVILQLALSLVVVASAALLERSLARLRSIDTGLIDPPHTLLVSSDFDLAGEGYAGFGDNAIVRERRLPLAAEILRRTRALPGVQNAVLMDTPPLGLVSGFDAVDAQVVGYVPAPNETMVFQISFVTPGFFSTIGPAVVRGREFTELDRADAPPVVVVNEAFARRFWPGGDPAISAIGKTVRAASRTATIVGVTRDAKYHALSDATPPFIYMPYAQWSPSALTLALRTSGDPIALVPAVRGIFHDVAAALPVIDPRTLEDQVSGALTLQRLAATLSTVLGGLALLVATLGLYGTLSESVERRRSEIAVRMALGARAGDVLRLFATRGLLLVVIGVVLGTPVFLGASRLLQSQVYGVGGWADLIALGVTAAMFTVVAVGTSFITASRAARVDPVTAMRSP